MRRLHFGTTSYALADKSRNRTILPFSPQTYLSIPRETTGYKRQNRWQNFTKFAAGSFVISTGIAAAVSYHFSPKEGYVREKFDREFYDTNATHTHRAKWAFILCGTGLSAAISHNDFLLHTTAELVHFWLEYKHATAFRNVNQGEIFFRGDFDAEGLFNGKSRAPLPYSTFHWEPSPPSVIDSTTMKGENNPGFTTGVVSLSKDIRVALSFGGSKNVLVIAPQTEQRVAPVSQHVIQEEPLHDDEADFCSPDWWGRDSSDEYEYVTGKLHRADILGIAQAEFSETLGRYTFVNFTLNPEFKGDIQKLTPDQQMRALIDLLPETDPRKNLLLRNANGDHRTEYRSLLSFSEDAHKAQLSNRLEKIERSGFNGNALLQTFFGMTAKRRFEQFLSEAPCQATHFSLLQK